ncbi:MAG: hypothetical protein P8J01_05020 [Acidimicrobiales bacterium]|nr:hypothetical protein [Acidimicrobiales bacterium]MDG1845739.1 hypothetical protein [Acidimicrobiales bacterium]
MANKAFITGGLLVVLGLVITVASDSNSVTSLIPTFVGVIFELLGFGARKKPDLSHHFMHAAAALSLIAIIGSIGSLVGRGSTGWALFAQLGTIVICGGFMIMAIQSFKAARAARLIGDI